MMKRVSAVLMAAVLALSMSVLVFATDPTDPPAVYRIPIITLPIEIEPDPCPELVFAGPYEPPAVFSNPGDGDCQGEDD